MKPTIGIVGPLALSALRGLLPASCFADPAPPGLGGMVVPLLAGELVRRGRRVTVFSLDPTVTGERVFEGERLKICLGPYTERRARHWFARERRYLEEALRRERPDVLSAHWTYEFALAALASGIPSVITAHDAPWRVLRHNLSPYRAVRTAMAYQTARRARHLVAVSPSIAEHFRRWHLYRGDIRIIPNGLPDSTFELSRPRPPDRPPSFAALFSGGWGGLRNGATLMTAFAQARSSLPGCRLLLAGTDLGPAGSAAAWARSRGLDGGIEFRGALPHAEVMRMLAEEADILVHPALEESFGMPLLEAGSQRLPIIAGRASGAVPWLLDEGALGRLVDVRSPQAVAAAMIELGRDPAQRLALGTAAWRAMRARFSLSAVADSYEAVLAEALSSPP